MAFRDFEEFVECFNAHAVRYLIGGGHAVAFHARPRATKDLDIFVGRTRANATRALAGISDSFGGSSPGYLSLGHLLDREIGVAPVRIDLLTSLSTVAFAVAWRERSDAKFGRFDAHYLSLEHLMAEKTRAARPQDLADLAVLERVSKSKSKSKSRAKRK